MIAKDLVFDELDYDRYPLLKKSANEMTSFHINNAYFWCGESNENSPYERPLVLNKDPLTNINLTYQLSVLSYYMGLYVFGIDFFAKNYIVNNPEVFEDTYLYIYRDGTFYEIFEDIYVKPTHHRRVLLRQNDVYSGLTQNINYDTIENKITFIGIDFDSELDTSWAIGRPKEDGSIKLLLACNELINGIQFLNQHIRPNVVEIGNRDFDPPPVPVYRFVEKYVSFDVFINTQYNQGRSLLIDDIEFDVYITVPVYRSGDSVIINTISFNTVIGVDYLFGDSKFANDIEFNAVIVSNYDGASSKIINIDNIEFDTIIKTDYTFSAPRLLEINNVNFNTYLINEYVRTKTVDWVSGGTQPVGEPYCEINLNIGNVKCDISTSCVFVNVGQYISTIDYTSPQPQCSSGVIYTVCVPAFGNQYLCTEYEGEVNVTYSNCQKCEAI